MHDQLCPWKPSQKALVINWQLDLQEQSQSKESGFVVVSILPGLLLSTQFSLLAGQTFMATDSMLGTSAVAPLLPEPCTWQHYIGFFTRRAVVLAPPFLRVRCEVGSADGP